jgi:hypothetical protein
LGDVRNGLTVTFSSALSSSLGKKKAQPQLIGVWTQTRQQGRWEGLGSRSVTITFAVRQSTLWHDLMTKLRLTARLAVEGLAIMNNHCVIRSHF